MEEGDDLSRTTFSDCELKSFESNDDGDTGSDATIQTKEHQNNSQIRHLEIIRRAIVDRGCVNYYRDVWCTSDE